MSTTSRDTPVTLFDNPLSPFAFKVRVTLYEKGVIFEKHELLHHSQREELLRLNPRGEVPTLKDGDTVICDSRIICDYLEDRYPTRPLLPSDAAARARCRALEQIADTQLDSCLYLIGLAKVFVPGLDAQFPDLLPRAVETLHAYHALLDRELEGRTHLAGDFSRADISVFPHIATAVFLGYPIDGRHRSLTEWQERLSERPSISKATQETVAFFEASQSISDPFFTGERVHWRNDRIERAVRLGLGPWLLQELATGRAFLSPVP